MNLSRRWRTSLWALSALALLVLFGAQPLWTDYGVLPERYRTQAQAVLDRAGASEARIAILDDRAACAGGTVHGLGPTSILIINRATLSLPTPEILWAIAHEARHHIRYDPLLGVAIGWLWLGVALGGSWVLPAVVRRQWPRFQAAPLIVAGFATGWVAGLPLFNLIQRDVERSADMFASQVTSPASGIAFIQREAACFQQDYTPGTYDRVFRLNHPPPGERIASMSGVALD